MRRHANLRNGTRRPGREGRDRLPLTDNKSDFGPAALYDRVPYRGGAHPSTHPDRLATLAVLHGMSPAPVGRCRVLEIGCGDGGNLLPMAWRLPESDFVGVDVAEARVAEGRRTAERLGLSNVRLEPIGVEKIEPEAGTFDYIIAHGVYSWVPSSVRETVLSVCRDRLAPEGVAFVSYSTYPGRYEQRPIREMMRFHVRGVEDPEERCRQARGFLGFLHQAQPEDSPYRSFLERAVERVAAYPDWLLLHDDLAEHSEPCYFQEFVGRAEEHGLQFLSEAAFAAGRAVDFPAHVGRVLARLGDVRLREQYLDFLRNRPFRESLLCRAEIELARPPAPSDVESLFVAAPAVRRSGEEDPGQPGEATFEGIAGQVVRTGDPLTKRLLVELGRRWPACLSFDELKEGVTGASGGAEGKEEARKRELAEILLQLYRRNVVELRTSAPPVAREPGERPRASPVARLELERSPDRSSVTGLRHRPVSLESADERILLPLLDGSRGREELAEVLAPTGEDGIEDEPTGCEAGADRLERALHRFVEESLLLAPSTAK